MEQREKLIKGCRQKAHRLNLAVKPATKTLKGFTVQVVGVVVGVVVEVVAERGVRVVAKTGTVVGIELASSQGGTSSGGRARTLPPSP